MHWELVIRGEVGRGKHRPWAGVKDEGSIYTVDRLSRCPVQAPGRDEVAGRPRSGHRNTILEKMLPAEQHDIYSKRHRASSLPF